MVCTLCPRNCGIDRSETAGFCRAQGDTVRVAKIMLHRWEEPCISGGEGGIGSGAVFFSGCSLRCVYCQNKAISRGAKGTEYTPQTLADALWELLKSGAYNLNFVTPTHYTKSVTTTIDILREKMSSAGKEFSLPVIWNTSGYEKKETVESLCGYTDVYLTDFKYYSSELSARYSNAPDYRERAIEALAAMVAQVGKPVIDPQTGLIKKGVIVRHLVLPGARQDSINVLRAVAETVGVENVILSLMSQFTPEFLDEGYPELNRRVTTFEYNKVLSEAISLGFDGYFQSRDSASAAFTPEF